MKKWSRRKILITQPEDNIFTQHIGFLGPAVEIPTLATLSREKSDAAAIYLGHSSYISLSDLRWAPVQPYPPKMCYVFLSSTYPRLAHFGNLRK